MDRNLMECLLRELREKAAQLTQSEALCLCKGLEASGENTAEAFRNLVSELASAEAESERIAGAALMGCLPSGDESAMRGLILLVEDSDWAVRGTAVSGLAKHVGSPDARKALFGALYDENPDVRLAALHAVEASGNLPDFREAIDELREDPDRDVSDAAYQLWLAEVRLFVTQEDGNEVPADSFHTVDLAGDPCCDAECAAQRGGSQREQRRNCLRSFESDMPKDAGRVVLHLMRDGTFDIDFFFSQAPYRDAEGAMLVAVSGQPARTEAELFEGEAYLERLPAGNFQFFVESEDGSRTALFSLRLPSSHDRDIDIENL